MIKSMKLQKGGTYPIITEPHLLNGSKEKFMTAFNKAAHDLHFFKKRLYQSLRSIFYDALRLEHRLSNEVHMIEEGLVHIKSASHQNKYSLKKDAVTLAAETALTVTEGLAPEIVPVIVAGIETGEEIIHRKETGIRPGRILYNTAVSLASSPVAAAHAAFDIVKDLEKVGNDWHARHTPSCRFC